MSTDWHAQLARAERFAGGRGAPLLAAGWAASEAILLPVAADVGLIFLVLLAPRRTLGLFAAALAGALVGTGVLVGLAHADRPLIGSALAALPEIRPGDLDGARADLHRDGIGAYLRFGPGLPLKALTFEAGGLGLSPVTILAGTVANRLTRVLPPLLLTMLLGQLAGSAIRRHPKAFLTGYPVAWAVFFARFWS